MHEVQLALRGSRRKSGYSPVTANSGVNNMGMLWVKVLHILFVIAWFAGLFYLPRLYVNLAQNKDQADTYEVLVGMAQRLYRFMLPLAVLAVLTGLGLFIYYGIGKGQGWIHANILLFAFLIFYHYGCGRYLKRFIQSQPTPGQDRKSVV